MAIRRRSGAVAQRLKALEAQLISLDEGLLLATACVVSTVPPGWGAPAPKRRLDFHPVEPSRRPAGRLRFSPLPPEVDRVVIQNWNPHTGFVPLGDVELELDPGQAVTLWVNRSSPTPDARQDACEDVRSSLFILSEDEPLII
jgi:hypothetical protein